jgi:uncharacterized protein YxjI
MRERLVSIGDDFWIEDSNGNRAFKVDGKALRIRNTLHFEDLSGRRLASIQERKARIRDTMEIEGPDGSTIAKVKKAMVTPLRDRYTVSVPGSEDLDVQGNIVDHEYEISAGGKKVAQISKRWFRVRDTYGVEIVPGGNDILILASTVAIDSISR